MMSGGQPGLRRAQRVGDASENPLLPMSNCYGWNIGSSRIADRHSSSDRSWKSSTHWPV